jgi:hypothetical protein
MDYNIYSKQEISEAIQALCDEYNAIIESLDKKAFTDSIPGKWSIADNMEHLISTNTVTALGFRMPKAALALSFGKHEGASRELQDLIRVYQLAISSGSGSPLLYVPKMPFLGKDILKKAFNLSCEGLLQAAEEWTESHLDIYQLPHPILGKVTGREMLGFSAYHLYHHLNTIKALALYAVV